MSRTALLIALLCSVSLISCGGGSPPGSTESPSSSSSPPAGDFSLSLQMSSVTLQQGGAFQPEGVQLRSLNGFAGTISLALSGLPTGITALPQAPVSLGAFAAPGATLQLGASTSAALGTSTVTVTGTGGGITHTATFSITVTPVAPFSIHVLPTALTVTPGTSATVQVSVTANPGTTPQLFTSVSGPPSSAGVNVSLPNGLLTLTKPVSFFINPTSLAQPLQNFPVVITAADNSGVNSSA